ncbi:MAG: TIGR02452 family protein [Candidatus Cloacimonetes bacterium]|nr:TIGR02452 family protein [Candidatus Cloacimonadota bacterium]
MSSKLNENGLTGWDCTSWLSRYRDDNNPNIDYHSLQREVYDNTVAIVKSGRYLSVSGREVVLDSEIISQSYKRTVFYKDTREIDIPKPDILQETRTYTIGADCLETTRLLQLTGYYPAVLNMASGSNPGGGVHHGAGAQEENLFRRSTAFTSMYQFVDYCYDYGVKRNPEYSYPIPRESGGIYTPDIIVFRSSERAGYHLLDIPYRMNMISVAAISNPPLENINGNLLLIEDMIKPTKEKIRAILRIGKANAHDAFVLGAFGCGAFANPPEHIAELFQEVFSEEEFQGVFKLIVFSIIQDHNNHRKHNPQGNVIPFQKVFNN